jgi:hypothetical protein
MAPVCSKHLLLSAKDPVVGEHPRRLRKVVPSLDSTLNGNLPETRPSKDMVPRAGVEPARLSVNGFQLHQSPISWEQSSSLMTASFCSTDNLVLRLFPKCSSCPKWKTAECEKTSIALLIFCPLNVSSVRLRYNARRRRDLA